MKASALDLFCGAGGLTRGLLDAAHSDVDITVEAGFDNDPKCAYPYEANNDGAEFVQADLSKLLDEDDESLTSEDISEYFENADAKILAGCAPCQPFSAYNRGDDSEEHEKWELLRAFAKLVRDLDPDIVTMENVPGVQNQDIFDEFVDTLDEQGFEIDYEVHYCPDYGIPQKRKRLVLIASQFGEISTPEATHSEDEYVCVDDHIGDLPELEAGEQHSDDRLHKTRNLYQRNIDRWEASEPGGTWRDWPEELRLACHQKESGRSYDSVYGIMKPDEPSPTITTQFYNFGTGRFGHPDQARALSLREGALLQSFPEDYEFVPDDESVKQKPVGELIGNAVPVRLGEVVGEEIQNHLASNRKKQSSPTTV